MTQVNTDLVPLIKQSFNIELQDNISLKELKEKLSAHIDHLIQSDIEKLVFLLYRVDVNEEKMRALLAQKEGENAAPLIADLVIERQLEKIRSRQQYRQRDNDIDEDEKW
jgi:hypothetical protein